MSIGLLSAARAAGARSLRGLRSTVGSTTRSGREVAQIALLHKAFLAQGGARGRLGFPLTPVSRLANGTVLRRYEGGEVHLSSGGATLIVNEKSFTVHLVGFECLKESSHDQSTPSDEPYVLWFVQSGSTVTPTQRLAFSGINTGSKESVSNHSVSSATNHVGVPFTINAIVMEHDSGDREQAARKLDELLRDTVSIANEVIDQINNYSGSDKLERFAAPVGMAKLGGLVAGLFGLKDDFVGSGVGEVFIVTPGETAEQLRNRIRNESFQSAKFNGQVTYSHSFDVGQSKAGRYRLYFRVEIVSDLDSTPT
jgi:hypothetical protein